MWFNECKKRRNTTLKCCSGKNKWFWVLLNYELYSAFTNLSPIRHFKIWYCSFYFRLIHDAFETNNRRSSRTRQYWIFTFGDIGILPRTIVVLKKEISAWNTVRSDELTNVQCYCIQHIHRIPKVRGHQFAHLLSFLILNTFVLWCQDFRPPCTIIIIIPII